MNCYIKGLWGPEASWDSCNRRPLSRWCMISPIQFIYNKRIFCQATANVIGDLWYQLGRIIPRRVHPPRYHSSSQNRPRKHSPYVSLSRSSLAILQQAQGRVASSWWGIIHHKYTAEHSHRWEDVYEAMNQFISDLIIGRCGKMPGTARMTPHNYLIPDCSSQPFSLTTNRVSSRP